MNTSELISQILEVERRAEGISLDAVEQEQRLDEELAASVAGLQASYEAQTQAQLAELRRSSEEKTARQLEALDSSLDRKLRKMDSVYAAEKDNWCDILFDRIVSV